MFARSKARGVRENHSWQALPSAVELLEPRRMLSAAPTAAPIGQIPTPDISAAFVTTPGRLTTDRFHPVTGTVVLRIAGRMNSAVKGTFSARIYASKDAVLDSSDKIAAVTFVRAIHLLPGRSTLVNAQLNLPTSTPPGSYYLLAVINPGRSLSGNIAAGGIIVSPSRVRLTAGSTHSWHHHHHDGGGSLGDCGGINNLALADAGIVQLAVSDAGSFTPVPSSDSTTAPANPDDSVPVPPDTGADGPPSVDAPGDTGGGADF